MSSVIENNTSIKNYVLGNLTLLLQVADMYNITENFWWDLITQLSIAFYQKLILREAFLWDFD